MKKSILLSLLAFSLSINILMAHGIKVDTEFNYPYVTVKASFSPRSLLADASVEVIAPEASAPYQKGKTDAKGRFTFIPDGVGTWKILIDDERGHRKSETVQISDSFFPTDTAGIETVEEVEPDTLCAHAENYHHCNKHNHSHERHIPLMYKVIFGLALIFGFTGIFYGMKSKNR